MQDNANNNAAAKGLPQADPECQKVNPFEGDTRRKSRQVRDMFDNIAPSYDLMNRLMSFGIDRLWRRALVKAVKHSAPRSVLDIACGTGDLAILLARRIAEVKVTGLDLSEQMIRIGMQKVLRAELADSVVMQQGDSLNLPYTDDSFDTVTVAYGVRNFEDLLRGYREMLRVLRPGGTLAVLELSTPTRPVVTQLYNFYAGKVIPAMGRIVAKDSAAYDYLQRSIAAVPCGDKMLDIMRSAGFASTKAKPMTFGTCTLYTAVKPL